jgi:zinc-ribbon domain
MLTSCTECNRQISDKAATCPSCGAPVGGLTYNLPPILSADFKPVTIERTSKAIKGRQLLAAAVFWIGVISLFGGAGAIGGWMIALGAIYWLYLRIARWWING